MAGSFDHTLDDDKNFRGTDLLENMRDMREAVEQMAFMLLMVRNRWGGERTIEHASESYYECVRGERPWPAWWKPETR